jgi:hypothetical protein
MVFHKAMFFGGWVFLTGINVVGQCILTETHQNILCYGESTGSVDLTVSGGAAPYGFLWSTGATTEDLTNIPAGSYTVRVTDASGCDAIRQVVISQTPLLQAGSINTTLGRFCTGGTKPIGGTNAPYGPASGGSGSYTYSWQKQEECTGPWADIPATDLTSYTPVSPLVTTCYRRKVMDIVCGTEAFTGVKTMEMYPDLVSQDILSTPPGADVCSGNPVYATFTGGSGGFPGAFTDTYLYSTNSGSTWSSYLPDQQVSTQGLSGSKLIQIRTRRIPTGVDACNYGKYITASWNVIPSPTPGLTNSDADNTICKGEPVAFTGSGGVNYNFRVDGTSVQNGSSPVFLTTQLTNGQAVDVIVTNALDCSVLSPAMIITVHSSPLPNPIVNN